MLVLKRWKDIKPSKRSIGEGFRLPLISLISLKRKQRAGKRSEDRCPTVCLLMKILSVIRKGLNMRFSNQQVEGTQLKKAKSQILIPLKELHNQFSTIDAICFKCKQRSQHFPLDIIPIYVNVLLKQDIIYSPRFHMLLQSQKSYIMGFLFQLECKELVIRQEDVDTGESFEKVLIRSLQGDCAYHHVLLVNMVSVSPDRSVQNIAETALVINIKIETSDYLKQSISNPI